MQDLSITSGTGLRIELADYGARILDVRLPGESGEQSLVLGYDDVQQYLQDSFYVGATVGPIANRIRDGRLQIGGELIQLPKNFAGHCLHSGELGFDRHFWSVEQQSTDAVRFSLSVSPEFGGLPGQLQAIAEYSVQGNTLRVDYTVKSDAVTFLNLTNHVYWNLNKNGADISNHAFALFVSSFAEKDDQDIPNGKLRALPQPFNYSLNECDLPELSGAVDHHFVVAEDVAGNGAAWLNKMAAIYSPQSGIHLKVSSTKPGFQLYTGQFLQHPFAPLSGFCVEPQFIPNAINIEQFAAPLVTPDQPYRHSIEYRLERG